MKKLLALAIIGISLSGCIVAPPYDDGGRHHDRGHQGYDRGGPDRPYRPW